MFQGSQSNHRLAQGFDKKIAMSIFRDNLRLLSLLSHCDELERLLEEMELVMSSNFSARVQIVAAFLSDR